MPITVELPDGREIEVDTDDPQAAARAAHAFQTANPARSPEYQRARTALDQRSTSNSGVGRFTDQMFRNMGVQDEIAGATAYLGQGASNLINQAQGRRPGIPASVVSRAAIDREREMQGQYAQEHPGLNAASVAATIPAMAGNPMGALPRMGALAAGGTAAAVNAPFAVARQEGSLPERLPGAARESAAVGVGGAALQGVANFLTRVPPRTGQMVARMDRAGIDPSLPAANGGGISGAVTNMVGDNIIAGAAVRPRTQRQLTQARDAAHRLAGRVGAPQGEEAAGGAVQRAVQRFATDRAQPNPNPAVHPSRVRTQDWSHAAKAGALFDEALRPIEGNAAQLTNTQSTISQIMQQADSPVVRAFNQDATLRSFTQTLARLQKKGGATLRDLRELRRRIRMARDPASALGQTRDNASLGLIEGALTQDIYAAAGQTAPLLQRADRFYARGRERINGLLAALSPDGATPHQAYQTILRWASSKSPNTQALASLRGALRPDEWRNFSASVIDNMGSPLPSSAGFESQIGFSVDRFATAYRTMTPAARRILFGGKPGTQAGQLADELDNLATVLQNLKGVNRMANFSGSGRDANNFLTLMLGVGNAPTTLGGLASMGILGEMMTNATFVRWLTSAAKPGSASAGGVRNLLGGLATIAARDPAIAPLYDELAQRMLPGNNSEQQPESMP